MAMQTINACFSSRREADLALEHLTQEHGVERTDIFVQSATDENTAGTEVAGADAAAGDPGTDRRDDSALHGRVEIAIDISDDQQDVVCAALRESGATVRKSVVEGKSRSVRVDFRGSRYIKKKKKEKR